MESFWELILELFADVAGAFAIVMFMAIVGERVVEYFAPVFAPVLDLARRWECAQDEKPGPGKPLPYGWVTLIFSVIVQALIVAATQANVFAPFVPSPGVGYALTVIVGAAGSNFLHDLWPRNVPPRAE